jgi:hypothetical protein
MSNTLASLNICVQKLSTQEEINIRKLELEKNNKSLNDHLNTMQAAFVKNKIWDIKKYPTITVSFHGNSDNSDKLEWRTPKKGKIDPLEKICPALSPTDAIIKIITERYNNLLGIQFVFLPIGQKGIVRIGFNPTAGSYSLVGTDLLGSSTPTNMNFGWLNVPTILHEFGHALGLIHEHQNSIGHSIEWNKKAVYAWASVTQGWDRAKTDINIINKYSLNMINGSEYDKESIMLYYFPAKLTENHKGTDQNSRLSSTDVKTLAQYYPGGLLAPETYYKQIYGESISKDTPPPSHKILDFLKSKIFIFSLIGTIIFILLLFIIIKLIKKYKMSTLRSSVGTTSFYKPKSFSKPSQKKISYKPVHNNLISKRL